MPFNATWSPTFHSAGNWSAANSQTTLAIGSPASSRTFVGAESVPGSIVEITPIGDFVTYGIGVSLMTMRDQVAARGRAPVG